MELGRSRPLGETPAQHYPRSMRRARRLPAPALGALTAVLIILFMGIIATNVVGRRVLAVGDRVLLRVPVYRRLYPSVKQLIES